MLYLYTVGILFLIEWCIRQLYSSSITSHNIASIAHNRHTDITISTFHSVAKKAMPDFVVFIDGAVAVKCFGVATSYLIVIGDTMPDVME